MPAFVERSAEGKASVTIASKDEYRSGGMRVVPPVTLSPAVLNSVMVTTGVLVKPEALSVQASVFSFEVTHQRASEAVERGATLEQRVQIAAQAIADLTGQANSEAAFTASYRDQGV